MVVLDTDHLTLAFWGSGADADNVRRRIGTMSPADVWGSIISYDEQTRGWLAYAAKAKTVAQQVEAYARLEKHLEVFKQIPLMGFRAAAAVEFQRLRKLGVRIGTMDLRIAAIALANDAIVVTRNIIDFQKVPGLRLEDWTK